MGASIIRVGTDGRISTPQIKLPDGSEEVRKVGPQDCLGAAEKPVVRHICYAFLSINEN